MVKEKFPVTVEALGTANANESVMLTAQKSDIVQSIEFDDGDLVKKGQLLIKLSDREERARLNELDINLQEAKRQLKRIDNLAQKSVASAQLLDEQEANVKALKAQLEVAKAQLEERLYSFDTEVESNTIEVHVSRLRKKLGRERIETVRGLGYRLGAP